VVAQPRLPVVVAIPAVDQQEPAARAGALLPIEHELAQRFLAVLMDLPQRERYAVDEALELGQQRAVDADVDLALLEGGIRQVHGAEECRVLAVLLVEMA